MDNEHLRVNGCFFIDGPRAGETVDLRDSRGGLPDTVTTATRDDGQVGAVRYERADWGDPTFARYRLAVELTVTGEV